MYSSVSFLNRTWKLRSVIIFIRTFRYTKCLINHFSSQRSHPVYFLSHHIYKSFYLNNVPILCFEEAFSTFEMKWYQNYLEFSINKAIIYYCALQNTPHVVPVYVSSNSLISSHRNAFNRSSLEQLFSNYLSIKRSASCTVRNFQITQDTYQVKPIDCAGNTRRRNVAMRSSRPCCELTFAFPYVQRDDAISPGYFQHERSLGLGRSEIDIGLNDQLDSFRFVNGAPQWF